MCLCACVCVSVCAMDCYYHIQSLFFTHNTSKIRNSLRTIKIVHALKYVHTTILRYTPTNLDLKLEPKRISSRIT